MNKIKLLQKWSEPQQVLNHGQVRLVDVMGDDSAITQMARVSYGAGTKSTRDDRKLIRYLVRNYHTSPLEGCVIKLHIKLPILAARQMVRHRTSSLNEVSARYSVLPDEFYVPDLERIKFQSTDNKQGSGSSLELPQAKIVADEIEDFCEKAYTLYESLIERGVARELARSVLPVNIYTEWYWVQNLHNLMHFLRLRLHPHAQEEIRVFAEKIADIVSDWVPIAWGAFEDYRLHSHSFSKQEMQLLRTLLASYEEVFLRSPTDRKQLFDIHNVETLRERKEFIAKIYPQKNS